MRLASQTEFPRPQALRALEKNIRRAIAPCQHSAWTVTV
jgi:hypothetical protein